MIRALQVFCPGRIATAGFFAQEVPALVTAERSIADRLDTVLMSVPEDAW
ncbi:MULTISPECIES: hypothetical protein [Streptomyces]|uniref:Uncharacterized protein n=2 Tax=Streptomyces TaxID=1883 RepID=A0ABV9IRT2_9ACTN